VYFDILNSLGVIHKCDKEADRQTDRQTDEWTTDVTMTNATLQYVTRPKKTYSPPNTSTTVG